METSRSSCARFRSWVNAPTRSCLAGDPLSVSRHSPRHRRWSTRARRHRRPSPPTPYPTFPPTWTPEPTSLPTSIPTPKPTATRVLAAQTPLPDVADRCGQLAAHASGVTCLAVARDGKVIASGGQDDQIKLWRVGTGEPPRAIPSPSASKIAGLALSPDGTLLAVATSSKTITMYRTGDLQSVRTLSGHTASVTGIAFSPDGKLIVSASQDRTARIWDAATGKQVRELKHAQNVLAVAFSPDGALIATGSGTVVQLWRTADGTEIRQLKSPTKTVDHVVFSPNGGLLAVGSHENVVRLYKPATGELAHEFKGHASTVTGMAFSPDNKTLASIGLDSRLYFWQVEPVKDLYNVRLNAIPHAIAYSPDGKWFVVGDAAGGVEIWDVSDPSRLTDTCLFDAAATASDTQANTYRVTDSMGITRTYTLPCGSPLPPGAMCICNCVPGTSVKSKSTSPGQGGVQCTCNRVCTCVPVRR